MRVATLCRYVSAIASVLVALCFLNRPRFWWQEIVCNLALYLLPWLIVELYCNAKWLWKKRSPRALVAVSFLTSGYSAYSILVSALPYFHYNRWPVADEKTAEKVRILFVDDCQFSGSQISEMRTRYQPDLVVAAGAARESLSIIGQYLPYRYDFDGEKGLSITSSLRIEERGVPNLGFNARAGGVVALRLSTGRAVDFGVVNLRPAFSTVEFERNRISARRLASYMRNSDSTRIAIGNLYATQFSQVASVFTSQARLRSVWYGRGLVKTYHMGYPLMHFSLLHGFVSRDLFPSRVERVAISGCALAGFFTEVEVYQPAGNREEHTELESTLDEADS